jgi:transposase-like protein
MVTEWYPKNAREFGKFFSDEEACVRYLIQVRWPEGFVCPVCLAGEYWLLKNGLMECRGCGRQVSATSGTLLHRTQKSVDQWFRAMWWIATQTTGGSAKGLQKQLGFGSYQTAWAWLHKLKRGMVRNGRDPLQGPVEVDEAFIGGKEAGVSGRQSDKKARIVVAVEIKGPSRRANGRIRLRHVPDCSATSLVPFVADNVTAGSVVITDGWLGYTPLKTKGFVHEVRVAKRKKKTDEDLLPNVHLIISLVKRWLLGTHHGAVSEKHLQFYLDEYTFRHNRRKSKHVGNIFYRLVQGVCEAPPQPYWKLVGRVAPNQPLHIGVT